LIPGLWDMHVHLGNAAEAALPLLVASGITGVRDMGSPSFEVLRRWRTEALAGLRVGPRIVAAGPILDGGAPDSNRLTVRNEFEARRAVDHLAEVGVDFIKVHEHLSRETYFAIADEARKLNIVFAGHVPTGKEGY
jgi:Amidohydrolase family